MPPGLLEGLFGALFGALSGVVGYKFFNSECRMKYGQRIQSEQAANGAGDDELTNIAVGKRDTPRDIVPIHAKPFEGVPCFINGTLFVPKRAADGAVSYVPAAPAGEDG